MERARVRDRSGVGRRISCPSSARRPREFEPFRELPGGEIENVDVGGLNNSPLALFKAS